MSRLLRNSGAETAASLGSFVLTRGEGGGFRARTGSPHDPDNDFEATPMMAEQEALSATADAYSKGYEEGRRTAELEFAAERDAVARLAEALDALRPEPTNALALLLAETVDRLVREIVGSVDVDATLLLARARAAAELIGENVEPSKLRLHPEDAVLLADADLQITVQADATLQRGTVLLETGHGWIEDGPAVRIERLRAALDKMGGAQ
jgi:flagellar assembly protein FliH